MVDDFLAMLVGGPINHENTMPISESGYDQSHHVTSISFLHLRNFESDTWEVYICSHNQFDDGLRQSSFSALTQFPFGLVCVE